MDFAPEHAGKSGALVSGKHFAGWALLIAALASALLIVGISRGACCPQRYPKSPPSWCRR
jgi:hypothetical protein